MAKINLKNFTAAHAASLVHRMVAKLDKDGKPVLDKDRNPVGVEAPVEAEEVMSFATYDDKVVVVTTGGEKLAHEWTASELKDIAEEKASEAKAAKKPAAN